VIKQTILVQPATYLIIELLKENLACLVLTKTLTAFSAMQLMILDQTLNAHHASRAATSSEPSAKPALTRFLAANTAQLMD
jgi:Tfp pilus assembly protein PilV